MSNTQTTMNTQSPATYLNKTYYDRNLLENARTVLCHAKYGQKRRIPLNNGKKVEFRRFTPFNPNDIINGLTEGVTPSGQNLAQSNVEATVKQYGAYVEVSDLLGKTTYDDVYEAATDELGEQIGVAIEWVTRDVMNAGTNVQYANGKTSRATLANADVLNTTEVRKAVRTLKKAKAKPFKGGDEGKAKRPHFICICSPDTTFDLQSDQLWQDVSKYSDKEQIYSGEIGRIFGVVFVESTEAKTFAGAASVTVQSSLFFGKDAYGTIDIEGSGAPKTIIKDLGSAGSADPLNQRATVAAKVEAYTAAILNQLWILRLEHGATV